MTYEVEENVKEIRDEVKKVKTCAEQIHRGLVKAPGYVDGTEFKEGDWKHWNYLQESNRYFDLRHIDAQVNEYLKEEGSRGRAGPAGNPASRSKPRR